MRHALSVALQDYVGAMVIVSHDRHLLSAVCEHFVLVDEGQAQTFDGDISSYRQWLLQPRAQIRENGDSKANRKAQRQQDVATSPAKKTNPQNLQKRQQQLEQSLNQLNQKMQSNHDALAEPGLYNPEGRIRLQVLTEEQAVLIQQLAQTEAEWLQVSEQLAS